VEFQLMEIYLMITFLKSLHFPMNIDFKSRYTNYTHICLARFPIMGRRSGMHCILLTKHLRERAFVITFACGLLSLGLKLFATWFLRYRRSLFYICAVHKHQINY